MDPRGWALRASRNDGAVEGGVCIPVAEGAVVAFERAVGFGAVGAVIVGGWGRVGHNTPPVRTQRGLLESRLGRVRRVRRSLS